MTEYYYSLDGFPCKVNENPLRGEIYRVGIGFEPYSFAEIEIEGDPLSKDEFNELVLRRTKEK